VLKLSCLGFALVLVAGCAGTGGNTGGGGTGGGGSGGGSGGSGGGSGGGGVTSCGGTAQPCLSSWADVNDFFIQDVMLDANGNVLMGVGPFDADPRAASHRDLKPGEPLPYHKTEVGSGKMLDEFLIDTGTSVGIVTMKIKASRHTLQMGDGPANIYLRSAKTVASYSTIDANGPTYHVGSNCVGGVPVVSSLYDTKVRVDTDALTASKGSSNTYGLGFAKVYNPSPSCPTVYDKGTANIWFFTYYQYPLKNGSLSAPIETLVSTDDADQSNHVEIYYQTREFGRTRYEAYQNIANVDQSTKDKFTALHNTLLSSGDCSPLALSAGPSTVGGNWLEIACGAFTNITSPDDMVHGDSPQQWIDMAKASNMDAVLFGVKPTDDPVIFTVSPATIAWGFTGPITITGSGFGNRYFGNQNIVNFNGGAVHYNVTSGNLGTTITLSLDSQAWQGSRKDHTLKCGPNPMHVFDGVSMSNEATLTIQNC
jgi:hypothetical protein